MQNRFSSIKKQTEEWQQMKFNKEGEVQKDNMHMLISVISLNHIFAV